MSPFGTNLPIRNVRFHGKSWRVSGRATEIAKATFMNPGADMHYFLRPSGLAVSRAHAMKSCANGLSVRFFRVMIAVG